MHACKLLVAVVAAAAVALPLSSAGHPGPEPHPTVQELEDTATALRVVIGDAERRLGERMERLEAADRMPDDQAVASAVERAVGPVVADLARSSGELTERIDTLAAVGAALLAGLTGLSGFLGFRLRSLRRLLSDRPPDAGRPAESAAESAESEREEAEEETDGRRIVTHTRKDRIRPGMQPTVRELHCPGAAWSPRTRDEAIADILERGVGYRARGPLGNEAEIEVRHRLGKPYLSTKPDEHGGNNLSELPDPP